MKNLDTDFIKNKKANQIFKIGLIIILSLLIFFLGFLTSYLTTDPMARTLQWVKREIQAKYYQEISDEQLLNASLSDIFSDSQTSLLDKYSRYYSAQEYKEQENKFQGNYSGFGIVFQIKNTEEKNELYIYSVSGNSSAEKAGLKAGMKILSYGEEKNQLTEYKDYSAFYQYVKNFAEDKVLYLKTKYGKEEQTYALQKSNYQEGYVYYASTSTAYRYESEGNSNLNFTAYDGGISELNEQTAYIRLTAFNGNATNQFALAMNKFKSEGKNNLILDLRGNGGGNMNILMGIASFLCKDAKKGDAVAIAKYRNEKEEKFSFPNIYYNNYFKNDSKITVLANVDTASASECLIGAMVDYGTIAYQDICLSEYNGVARSYGKGIMQTTFENFWTGEAIKLTTATIHWPISNRCIHNQGITVDMGARPFVVNDEVDSDGTMLKNVIATVYD